MILNLTQHDATPEQLEAGVIELDERGKSKLRKLLTFEELPSYGSVLKRAELIALLAVEYISSLDIEDDDKWNTKVMIGGAPYLMPALVKELEYNSFGAVCAFSKRVSKETTNPDGTVTKVNVFKHMGFVPA